MITVRVPDAAEAIGSPGVEARAIEKSRMSVVCTKLPEGVSIDLYEAVDGDALDTGAVVFHEGDSSPRVGGIWGRFLAGLSAVEVVEKGAMDGLPVEGGRKFAAAVVVEG